MSALFRRCGCRTPEGKQYGPLPEKATDAQKAKACPKLITDPKHGRWTFRMSAGYDPVTKKRRQENGGTFATKTEAREARNALAARIDKGTVLRPCADTFAEYLPKWLSRRSRLRMNNRAPLAPNTVKTYERYILNDIAPSRLGGMKVREIRRAHVQAFIDDLVNDDRGAVTVRRILAVLQGAFTTATVDQLIHQNPARNIDLPEVDRKQFRPWEPHEVGKFLDVAAEHRLGALFELAMFTGLRRGELLGLRWEDVDLARRQLIVRNNRTNAGDGATKTEASQAEVPLNERAVGALVAWQIEQASERAELGDAYEVSAYVFTMEDGRPLKPQYATRLFERLRQRAGLSKMTFHGQRHQSASLLIASGQELITVSKILRHSSASVTDEFYAHLIASKAHDAVEGAGAIVPARSNRSVHTSHTQGGDRTKEAAPAMSENGL